MKRLNPETGKPFVRGDARADGFLFCSYTNRLKQNGYFVENWLRPQSLAISKAASLKSAKIWLKQNPLSAKNNHDKYRLSNPQKYAAWAAKRHAAKLQRTPPWLTDQHYNEIETFYIEAKRISKDTGIPHAVDHIVPLQGKLVCGLHVPWNLQVITKKANSEKGNRH